MIRVVALRDVLEDSDPEYRLRAIFRWYSKTFATPLHVVETLPEEDVLRAFYEDHYQKMRDEAEGQGEDGKRAAETLAHERRIMSMTDEELIEARREEDAEAARVDELLRKEAEREAAEAAKEAAQARPVSLDDLPPDVEIALPPGLDVDPLAGLPD